MSESLLETLEVALHNISHFSIVALEIVGILMIVYGAIKAFYLFCKSGFDFSDREVVINFGEALSLSLQFNLGAEIIKTITVRDVKELILLAAVVVIRIAITVLIHWEVQSASKSHDAREEISVKSSTTDSLSK